MPESLSEQEEALMEEAPIEEFDANEAARSFRGMEGDA